MSAELEVARDVIDSLYRPLGMVRTERRQRAQTVASLLQEKCGANPPRQRESCAVAHGSMKVAALYYDRLWLPPLWSANQVPKDIAFFCGSKTELWMLAARMVVNAPIAGFPPLDINYVIENTQNSPLRERWRLRFNLLLLMKMPKLT
jgi:hypothetical protein